MEKIEKLAEKSYPFPFENMTVLEKTTITGQREAYIKGYQKAQEEKQDTKKLLEEAREEAEK